jgi:anti-sigma regulatory factor (Ser/Thr protein kinase)
MIELLLNTVKLLAAKETREASSSMLEMIRKTPEWQRDICTLTLRVDSSNKELTHLIRTLCVEKLANLNYDSGIVNNFQTSYIELVANAFEHGCSKNKEDPVEIETDITKAYVTLRVKNAKNARWNFSSTFQSAVTKLENYPKSPRGRGLALVNWIADEFEGQEDNQTVKAVFYKDCVELETFEFQSFTFLRLKSGLFNPSCSRRIEKLALSKLHLHHNLILDLSLWKHVGPTIIQTMILHLENVYENQGRKFIVVASQIDVPGASMAHSWQEALGLIDSSNLLSEMEKVIPKTAEIRANFLEKIQLPPNK